LVALTQPRFGVMVDAKNGTETLVQHVPPEEQVESAAARLRPLILNDDPTFYAKFFNAIGFFLNQAQAPEQLMAQLRGFKTEWAAVQPKSDDLRGYEVRRTGPGSGGEERVSDNELAFGWLYGDVVHADADRLAKTRSFGVVERFRPAVPVVARIMVLTIGSLNFARYLHANGMLPIGDDVFDLPVAVTETALRVEGRIYVAEVQPGDGPVVLPPIGKDLGPGWTPFQQAFGPIRDAAEKAGPSPASTGNEASC
jgi:hypothetical protein